MDVRSSVYNLDSGATLSRASVSLTERERRFIRNNPADIGARSVRLAAMDLARSEAAKTTSLDEIRLALGGLAPVGASDDKDVYVNLEAMRGFNAAIDYDSATAKIAELVDEYGDDIKLRENN